MARTYGLFTWNLALALLWLEFSRDRFSSRANGRNKGLPALRMYTPLAARRFRTL